jgi:hypothetical protein
MKHRQCPEIDRVLTDTGGKNIADRIEIGAAMMSDDALGIASGAGSVAQRDRAPFVLRKPRCKIFITLRQRFLVLDLADPLASGKRRIIHIDDKRLCALHQAQRLGNNSGEFRIHQDDFGAAVIELKGDRGRIEPDVQRVEDGACHWNREMQFVHGRDVGEHGCNRIARADIFACEKACKAPAPRISLRPVESAAFVDGARVIGINRRRARDETERRQRDIVGRRLFQPDVVLVWLRTHRSPSTYNN